MAQWESLIPSVIKNHFKAVMAGEYGYDGSIWRGATAQSWHWPEEVTRLEGHENVLVLGRTSIFGGEHVVLDANSCWLFDCRQRSSKDPRKPWSNDHYRCIMDCKRPWVRQMPQWNALFLLPPRKTYETIRPLLAIPGGGFNTHLVWGF